MTDEKIKNLAIEWLLELEVMMKNGINHFDSILNYWLMREALFLIHKNGEDALNLSKDDKELEIMISINLQSLREKMKK